MTSVTRGRRNRNRSLAKSTTGKALLIGGPVVVIGIAVWLISSYGAASVRPPATAEPSGPADSVEVVYFHRTQRCYSCQYAETGISYTLENYFRDELGSGKLTFQSVDVQDSSNASIVAKYDAYTSSLFINSIRTGSDHIEHVVDIWYVVGNDEAFVETVKNSIEKSLNGES